MSNILTNFFNYFDIFASIETKKYWKLRMLIWFCTHQIMIPVSILFLFLSYLSIKTFSIVPTLFCAKTHRKCQMSRIGGYFFSRNPIFSEMFEKTYSVKSETRLCWDEKTSRYHHFFWYIWCVWCIYIYGIFMDL